MTARESTRPDTASAADCVDPAAAPSLATLLALVEPHVAAALVPPAAFRTAIRAATVLPPAGGTGFECRLNGERSNVDLGIGIGATNGGSELFAGIHPAYRLGTALAADPLWQRVTRLCRVWGGELLRRAVDFMCIEVDEADLQQSMPRPSILFCEVIAAAQRDPDLQARAMLDVFLPLARERVLAAAQRDCIDHTVAAARPFGHLCHFGSAMTRPDSAVRLVFGVARPRLGACLEALGFADRAGPIVETVEAVGHSLDEVMLQVDAAATLGPRIGIDLPGEPVSAWKAVIRGLVERRLCGLDRAVALAEWLHFPPELRARAESISHRLPDDPARLSDAVVWRKINHVKLAFTPDGAIEAKAYLFAGFMWGRPPGEAAGATP